jgi:hypothetical protein
VEKRYQVFISSTFRDLVDERQGILRAALELDHMPAGMELFPAADDTAWDLISDVIDASDYYVLIIGGRYGSLDDTGIGYTEKEYEYAVLKKKPVIALLHKNPDNLPREKTETDETTWKKLKQFREKVEKRHTCVYWVSAEELKAKVIVALTAAVKRNPGVGWVRADQVPAEATLSELLSLRRRITELEAEIAADRLAPPKGTEDLEQGDDTFAFNCTFKARPIGEWSSVHDSKYSGSFKLSWNDIFAGIAPILINEAPDEELRAAFHRHLVASGKEAYGTDKKLKDMELRDFSFPRELIETCVVQLRALGLIKENQKPRSVKDTRTYWTLTPYGDHLMMQLRALRRTPLPAAEAASELSTSLLNDESEDVET